MTITLAGGVVRLEPLNLEHVKALADAATPDRSSYGFTAVPDGVEGVAGARRYVEKALAGAASGRELPFAVRRLADGLIVGSTRFLDLEVFHLDGSGAAQAVPPSAGSLAGPPADEPSPTVAEIGGTWYAAGAQRTAVNTEAKLLLLTQAFEVWRCVRITFKTDARNQASRRGIERLGALPEGIRRAHVPATDGSIRDSAYYSILAAEWSPIRERLQRRLHPSSAPPARG